MLNLVRPVFVVLALCLLQTVCTQVGNNAVGEEHSSGVLNVSPAKGWRVLQQLVRESKENLEEGLDDLKRRYLVLRKMFTSKKQVERMLRMLMYLSRMDPQGPPIVIGLDTLRAVGKGSYIVNKLMRYSANKLGWELSEVDDARLLIKFSFRGIFPVYPQQNSNTGALGTVHEEHEWEDGDGDNNNNNDDNESPLFERGVQSAKETENAVALIEEIAQQIKDNEDSAFHVLFDSVLRRLELLGEVRLGAEMVQRVNVWRREWIRIRSRMNEHRVSYDLKQFTMWLLSPMHLEQMLEVAIAFTPLLDAALLLPRTILIAFGLDDVIADHLHRFGRKIDVNPFMHVLAKWIFYDNGIACLFLHGGVMDYRRRGPVSAEQGKSSQLEIEHRKAVDHEEGVVRLSEHDSRNLIKELTDTVVEHRGKSRGHILDRAIVKLGKWGTDFARDIHTKWEGLKVLELNSLEQNFKLVSSELKQTLEKVKNRWERYASADRTYQILRILFHVIKIRGPMLFASVFIQALGLEEPIFKWLDKKGQEFMGSNRVLRNHEGVKRYLVRFMVGECASKKSADSDEEERRRRQRQQSTHRSSDSDDSDGRDDVCKERPEECQPVLMVYQKCEGEHYGLIKQMIHGGPNFYIIEDLKKGKSLLTTLIKTIKGNKMAELDELVKITHHKMLEEDRLAMVSQYDSNGGQQASPKGFFSSLYHKWEVFKQDYGQVDEEVQKEMQHQESFQNGRKRWLASENGALLRQREQNARETEKRKLALERELARREDEEEARRVKLKRNKSTGQLLPENNQVVVVDAQREEKGENQLVGRPLQVPPAKQRVEPVLLRQNTAPTKRTPPDYEELLKQMEEHRKQNEPAIDEGKIDEKERKEEHKEGEGRNGQSAVVGPPKEKEKPLAEQKQKPLVEQKQEPVVGNLAVKAEEFEKVLADAKRVLDAAKKRNRKLSESGRKWPTAGQVNETETLLNRRQRMHSETPVLGGKGQSPEKGDNTQRAKTNEDLGKKMAQDYQRLKQQMQPKQSSWSSSESDEAVVLLPPPSPDTYYGEKKKRAEKQPKQRTPAEDIHIDVHVYPDGTVRYGTPRQQRLLTPTRGQDGGASTSNVPHPKGNKGTHNRSEKRGPPNVVAPPQPPPQAQPAALNISRPPFRAIPNPAPSARRRQQHPPGEENDEEMQRAIAASIVSLQEHKDREMARRLQEEEDRLVAEKLQNELYGPSAVAMDNRQSSQQRNGPNRGNGDWILRQK